MIKHKGVSESYFEMGYNPGEYRAEINDIANLTFLSKSKNCEIADTPPSQYLTNETTKEMRKGHFIPENPDLWKAENFSFFLQERRRLLAKAMTSLLKRL